MNHKIQNIYNSQAGLYKSQTQDFTFPEGIFEYFLDALNGKNILDIGCGYGREIQRLRELGYDAIGIDISKGLIDLADESIKPYISHGDMRDIKEIYKNKKFNGIISSASIVHMTHNDGIQVLQDIFGLLEEGGIFFLSLKVANQRKIVEKESISTPGSLKQYVYYEEQEIEDILNNIGFTLLKTHTWSPGIDTWKILIAKK